MPYKRTKTSSRAVKDTAFKAILAAAAASRAARAARAAAKAATWSKKMRRRTSKGWKRRSVGKIM